MLFYGFANIRINAYFCKQFYNGLTIHTRMMTSKTLIRQNSLKAWMLAARPKTLTGAAVPVLIATALALADTQGEGFRALPDILCFLFAFIMQIDANFINDYFDFLKGNDDETRLGPRRACAQGWISLNAMKKAIVTTTALACLTGLPLICYGGIAMILVGIVCIIFFFLYTTRLSYLGLGDVLVLVFFGIIPVCVTYYIVMPTALHVPTSEVITASLTCGMVIDTLLIVNNYRDINNDRRNGKCTLVVRIGTKASLNLYLLLGCATILQGGIFLMQSRIASALLPVVYLIPHTFTWLRMRKIGKGKALNHILGETACNILFYGLLSALGLLADTFLF